MSARAGEGRPPWLADLVHQVRDAVAAFAPDGSIAYANEAAHTLLLRPPGSLVGTSAFDLVHPEDVERAVTTIGSVTGGARPLPGLVRLLCGEDRWLPFEITLSPVLVPGGDGPLTAVTIRDTSFQDAQWRFLTALSSGADLHDCFAVLADGLSNATDGPMGIAYEVGGRRRVAGPLSPDMAGVAADGRADASSNTPWALAIATGSPVTTAVDDLPEEWRRRGHEIGAAACVAVPVPDPTGATAALIVQWPPHPALAPVVAHALARRPRQAVTVALDRRDAQRRLEHLAHHDALTGLVNRARFFTLLGRMGRDRRAYGVLYVDLDRFKPVNDRLGHVVGDHTLVVCARRLERAAGPGALTARLGGDEFAVALPDGDGDALGDLAEQVVTALGHPFRIGDHLIEVGASVGVAHTTGDDAPDAVVAAADGALYRAKRGGRSTWRRATSVEPTVAPVVDGGWVADGRS